MKKTLNRLSVLLSTMAYLYMIVKTYQGDGKGLSLATFALWAILSWITIFVMIKEKANPAVPIIYSMGSTTITIVLLIKGRYGWSELDTIVATLFVVCTILLFTNKKLAFVVSIVASTIAALPFLIMTWKCPMDSPIISNTGFFIANIMSFFSVHRWRLEDRLYPGVNIAAGMLFIIPWLIK